MPRSGSAAKSRKRTTRMRDCIPVSFEIESRRDGTLRLAGLEYPSDVASITSGMMDQFAEELREFLHYRDTLYWAHVPKASNLRLSHS